VGRAIRFVASTEAGSTVLRPLWDSERGSGIQAFFNGLWGDELDQRESSLSIEMSLRTGNGDVIPPDSPALAETFHEPTSKLVVLLHGLGDTERVWGSPHPENDPADSLADALTASSFTPLLIRYNSGLDVADNGLALSALMEEVIKGWPIPVEEVSFVGHSMGGLVAIGALSAAVDADHGWIQRARHIVTLGSPHLGAPLEKGVHLVSSGLDQTPEGKPISVFLDQRSAGIKSLRMGGDSNATGQNHPVDFHFVAGAITKEPDNFFGKILGDLVVPVASATGRSRTRILDAADVRVMGGRNHRGLLRDPEVHRDVLGWLNGSVPGS
jgi:pimeloyl-ACP methyl ester carboxylesterase